MTTINLTDIEAAAVDASYSRTYSPPIRSRECGRKFATVKAARRATNDGCPRCGGCDIDLA